MSVKFWWDDTGLFQDFACTAGVLYDFRVDARHRSSEPLVDWKGYLKAEFYNASWVQVGVRNWPRSCHPIQRTSGLN